ncbi:LPXTG cell wall anchor domain-containing protein [Streptomyces sp. NPDC001393]
MTGSRAAALTANMADEDDADEDFPGMASAMRAIEQAQDAVQMAHREAAAMTPEAPASAAEPSHQHSLGGGDYGDDEPSHKPSRSYGDDDEQSHGSSGKPGKTGSYGDDDKTGYGNSGSYGDDESSYGSSYGDDEHCGCYGEEEKPPHRHHVNRPPHKPEHKPHKPPHHHKHHHKHHHHRPPEMAHTGTEDTIAATAAGGLLLAAGTVLYRRGRAASRR